MRVVVSVLCAVAGLAAAGVARADDVQAARESYDRGARAYDTGDYALATSELARADELAASDVALELALKAAVKGDDPRAAMRLAGRADRRAHGGTLAAAAAAARDKMSARTGTITVSCPGRTSCIATIDAGDVPANEPYVVLVGVHRVTAQADGGRREAFDARVEPGASVDVTSSAAAPLATPPRHVEPTPNATSSGISPVWFWVGAGVTAVLGGVTIASAIDTRNKHDDFAAMPTGARQDSGLDAQLRTNLLAGGTALGAVATAVIGLALVQWTPTAPSAAPLATSGQAVR